MKAFASLLLGIFIYPWHNLPDTYAGSFSKFSKIFKSKIFLVLFSDFNKEWFTRFWKSNAEIEEQGIDSFLDLRKKNNPLIKNSGESMWTQIKQNASYLKSPIFIVLVISFAIGNFNVAVCLNVMRWVFKLLPRWRSFPLNPTKWPCLSISWWRSWWIRDPSADFRNLACYCGRYYKSDCWPHFGHFD